MRRGMPLTGAQREVARDRADLLHRAVDVGRDGGVWHVDHEVLGLARALAHRGWG